jgi:multidrug resistance protein, MATE family
LLLTQFAQVLLTVVDTALLGRFSTRALASVGLAAPIYLVATMAVRGWSTATQVLAARRYGAGEHAEVGKATAVGVALSVVTGIAVGGLLFALAPLVIDVLGGDEDLASPGTVYLRILAFAVPFAAATFTMQGAYSGVGATRAAMYTAFVINAVDIPLGLALIFGLRLGVVGAGLSTLLGTIAGACYLLWYGRARLAAELTMLRWKHLSAWRTLTPRLWTIGWPEITMLFIGYFNEVILIGFVAQLGTVNVAAYRLLESITLTIYTIMATCGSGVSILAGQRLGAGAIEQALTYYRTGLTLAAVLAAIPAVPTLARPDLVFGLLTADPQVIAAAVKTTPLAVLGLTPLLFSMNLTGVLRAAGDTRTVMIASLAGDYLVLVPLAWLFALPLGLGLNGIFLGWTGFGLVFLAVLRWRYRQGTWRTAQL